MVRYIKEDNEQIKEMPLEYIKGARLLDYLEAKNFMDEEQLAIGKDWWLKTPSNSHTINSVYKVPPDGTINKYSTESVTNVLGVRPALILKSNNLNDGNKFKFGNYIFTKINFDLAICDDIIGKCEFNKKIGYDEPESENYEKSYIKEFVDDWFYKIKLGLKSNKEIFNDEDWRF